MNKKILTILLCGIIVLGLTGCGNEKKEESIITPVTSETVTTGNIPKGNFEIGDEYIVKIFKNENLKNKYHFFILSVDDNNVNLIIDRNMKSSGEDINGVSASVQGDKHDYGPYWHMKAVLEAAHGWNIPTIEFSYTDPNAKYTINTLGTQHVQFKNAKGEIEKVYEAYSSGAVKARLPYLEEIVAAGCKKNEYGSCPLWLSNNLAYSEYVTGDKVTNSEKIGGYFTMSSDWAKGYGDKQEECYPVIVTYNGDYKPLTKLDRIYTVRPVITLPKDLFN